MAGSDRPVDAELADQQPYVELREEHNKVVDDLEALRAASKQLFSYRVEDLSANGDITERAFFVAPAAITILDSVRALHEAASTGVDGGNTAVITLRNITAGENIATVTLSSDATANAATSLTLAGANADVASGEVLGIVVTQGTTADLARFNLQFEFQLQTVDAAADMTAGDITTYTRASQVGQG